MLWPKGSIYGANCIWYDPKGGIMGLNVHVMCKYICNKVDLVVNGPHVQVLIGIYRDHVFIIGDMWIMRYECIWLCGGGSIIF